MHLSLAERAQTALNSAIQREIVAGAAIAATDGESAIVAAGGVAPNDPSASFDASYAPRIACLLKPFLATILHQLEEEGVLKVGDPVQKYLAELKLRPDACSRISLLHLMSHTSGLIDQSLQSSVGRRGRSALAVIKELGPLHGYCLPGEFVSYSNLGYLILEAVIEAVCDRGLPEVLAERILCPLQLAQTAIRADGGSTTMPDVGLRMSCKDILRFVSEFASNGTSDRGSSPALLRASTVDSMLRIRAALPGSSQSYDSWSAGWARFGAKTFGHNALSTVDDMRIVTRFSPKTGKAIVIVARTRRLFPLLVDLCNAVLPLESPRPQSIGELQQCAIDPAREGVYWLPEGRLLRLWQRGGHLLGSLAAGPEAEAEPVTLKTTTKSFLYVAGNDGKPIGLFLFVRSRTGCVFLWDGESLHPRVRATSAND